VVLGLLLLVWAATTGPVGMFSASGRTRTFVPRQRPTPSAEESGAPGTLREATRDVQPTFDLAWVGDLIGWTLIIGVCVAAVLAVRWSWQHRWRRPPEPVQVDFEVLPDKVADALRADVDVQRAAVAEGDPRNGIVACWLRLEEVVAAAGHPRRRSETSSELVVRVLRSLDLDPRAIGTLAALYREARFSEHTLGEDARTAAASALQALHEDLRSRRAVP
jgi:hypothetical protein